MNDNEDVALPENVEAFPGITKVAANPDMVLKFAMRAKATELLVVGYDQDGDFFFASSEADGPKCLWLLAKAQQKLLSFGDQSCETT